MTATASENEQTNSESKELNLFRLTWPIFLEVLLFMLMGIADTFMLSAVSDNAVSAVGASNQLIQIAILILEVIGNGSSIVIAQYIGSKMYREAAKISALAVTLNFIVGLIISIIFVIFGQMLLQVLHLEGEILHFAKSYIHIVGGAIFLQAIINSLSAIIRTYGFTKQTMYVSLGMNIVHVALNYLLISGHLGFPALGVQGAAISTIISRVLSLIVFFWLLYRVMEVRVEFKYYFNLSKEYIRKILGVGIPSAFEQITYQTCQTIFVSYATYLGAQAFAARQYAANISMFTYLFSVAIGIGNAIIIGRLVGASRNDDAYKRAWKSLRWAQAATLLMVAIVILVRKPLLGIFTDDPEIIRLGAQVILLSIVLETGRTFNIVLINSLRASGDAKFPVYMGLISMVGLSVPLGYLFVFHWNLGLPGIWLAIAADEWTRAFIMFFRWRSRIWEKHALVPPKPTGESAAVSS
ncbi:MATE family efflux transporter [Paenibacillus sediminis]|uniref:MATE family efflux protein n=1 Tax=Paenibacillus sediminis TaxID=664909 RepID=A0ABS4H2W6_9BACL|nr:MATE family efflux transporter [Paenibacillus sediminis]MBP1936801.1 putative MATE family efflux protein [Paenibacillus sediminis]